MNARARIRHTARRRERAVRLTLRAAPATGEARQWFVSRLLVGATILLPLGFFLGGVSLYSGDPGLGILVLAAGALLLLTALSLIARQNQASGAAPNKAQNGVDRGEPLFACRRPRRYRIVCATR